MKPLKLGLRVWFTITSLVSFLAGWMLLSHAGKPAPLFPAASSTDNGAGGASNAAVTVPTLAPIPSLNDLVGNSGSNTSGSTLQSLPSLPSTTSNNFFPTFRGRGS